jgi:hypothetical protein
VPATSNSINYNLNLHGFGSREPVNEIYVENDELKYVTKTHLLAKIGLVQGLTEA